MKKKSRILIVTDDKVIVKGVITNGDILRWMLNNNNPDLQTSVLNIINKNFISVKKGNENNIPELLKKVLFVPVLNDNNQLISVATRAIPEQGISINDKYIGGGIKNIHNC